MTTTASLVWCPFPDKVVAREISTQLLEEKLIGCANILGQIDSIFEWDGVRGDSIEVPVLFKTSADTLEHLIERIGELHPYDAPAILGWHCDAGHPSTLAWLGALGSGGTA